MSCVIQDTESPLNSTINQMPAAIKRWSNNVKGQALSHVKYEMARKAEETVPVLMNFQHWTLLLNEIFNGLDGMHTKRQGRKKILFPIKIGKNSKPQSATAAQSLKVPEGSKTLNYEMPLSFLPSTDPNPHRTSKAFKRGLGLR